MVPATGIGRNDEQGPSAVCRHSTASVPPSRLDGVARQSSRWLFPVCCWSASVRRPDRMVCAAARAHQDAEIKPEAVIGMCCHSPQCSTASKLSAVSMCADQASV